MNQSDSSKSLMTRHFCKYIISWILFHDQSNVLEWKIIGAQQLKITICIRSQLPNLMVCKFLPVVTLLERIACQAREVNAVPAIPTTVSTPPIICVHLPPIFLFNNTAGNAVKNKTTLITVFDSYKYKYLASELRIGNSNFVNLVGIDLRLLKCTHYYINTLNISAVCK